MPCAAPVTMIVLFSSDAGWFTARASNGCGKGQGGSTAKQPQDGDAADIVVGETAEIVGQRAFRPNELAIARAAEQLVIPLIHHAQARRADRVAEAFQPAIDIAGHFAIG